VFLLIFFIFSSTIKALLKQVDDRSILMNREESPDFVKNSG